VKPVQQAVNSVSFVPIGIVRSPFTDAVGTPVQPTAAADVAAEVIIDDAYAAGLKDLDGFSHIVLLFVLDRAGPVRLLVKPYLDTVQRGVFATRSPHRPNPIGLSITRLVRRDGNVLHIAGVDILDGSPVLDIKPYIPDLNPHGGVRVGWLSGRTGAFASATVSAAEEPSGHGGDSVAGGSVAGGSVD
jgi:tRNA-Thr(GGU) m(6)t(6)A37 methyltransferase TsaA